MASRSWWALCLALPGLGSPLAAQIPDTTRTDSLAVEQDTMPDPTALLLTAAEDSKVHLRTFPRGGQQQLLPAMSRIIITRDSIDFANAETVGDVLAEVPGTYLWRGGWIGRAELPNYQGRGSTSVEYTLDGVPYGPMGQDSLAVDPSLFPLGLIDRIEVETLPGLLRVHLYLRNHDLLSPRTRIAIARGDFSQARYEGLFEKRFPSGFGFALGAEYRVTPRSNRQFDNSNGWAQMDWVPNERFGVQVRYTTTGTDRKPELTDATPPDTLARELKGNRSDFTSRVFLRGRPDGLGSRVDILANRAAWRADSLEQTRWQAGVVYSRRAPTWTAGASALYGSAWTKFDARVNAGWTPTPRLTAAVEGAWQSYEDSRSGSWVLARAGFRLPLGVDLAGSWRAGKVLARPSMPGDTVQSLSDLEASLGWQIPRLGARLAYSRLGAFQPVGYRQFAGIDSIAPSGPTDWVTASARVAPRQWLTISGWYSSPLGTGPEGIPPTHSIVTAAIRSKFLRTFPSGIFDLKLAMSVESWGSGVLGRDPAGNPVQLAGATFARALLQMQFSGFIIYYDRFNLTNNRQAYVPGFPIPYGASTFGVRWSFLN